MKSAGKYAFGLICTWDEVGVKRESVLWITNLPKLWRSLSLRLEHPLRYSYFVNNTLQQQIHKQLIQIHIVP